MPVGTVPGRTRTMRVCEYVDVPFDRVAAALEAPDLDDVMTSALQAAVGAEAGRVTMRTSSCERVGERLARVQASWWAVDADQAGDAARGSGTLLALVVQSGCEPVTELLATVTVTDGSASRAAAVTRRFLEEVAAALVPAPPTSLPKSRTEPTVPRRRSPG